MRCYPKESLLHTLDRVMLIIMMQVLHAPNSLPRDHSHPELLTLSSLSFCSVHSWQTKKTPSSFWEHFLLSATVLLCHRLRATPPDFVICSARPSQIFTLNYLSNCCFLILLLRDPYMIIWQSERSHSR